MSSMKPVNRQTHQHLCVKNDIDFSLAKDQHLIPVFFSEFVAASAEFPVVFVKDQETGQIKSVVMTGLKPYENLRVAGGNGAPLSWNADYVPFILRVAPFAAVPTEEDSDNMMIFIDESSPLISDDGEALFSDAGEQSEYLNQRAQYAVQALEHRKLNDSFTEKLVGLNLLKSNNLDIRLPGQESYNLSGLYIIDEERLNALPTEDFLSLRDANYLPAIYAAQASSNLVSKLLRLRMASLSG